MDFLRTQFPSFCMWTESNTYTLVPPVIELSSLQTTWCRANSDCRPGDKCQHRKCVSRAGGHAAASTPSASALQACSRRRQRRQRTPTSAGEDGGRQVGDSAAEGDRRPPRDAELRPRLGGRGGRRRAQVATRRDSE